MDTADSAMPAQPSTVTPWPRSAQLTMACLLSVAVILLAVHYGRGLRWGSRPTNLERGTLAVYHIDLNRADHTELLQIPGIGESLAQRIEEDRLQRGPFQSFEDLRRVRGVGPTTLERLRPWLSVPSTEPSAPEKSSETSRRDPGDRQSISKKRAQLKGPIDINRATAAELQRLPGIGPRRAKLILEERNKRPFASIEELRRVPGIGPKTLERLRPYITIDSSPLRIATTGSP
jgi:competence protein ComEA